MKDFAWAVLVQTITQLATVLGFFFAVGFVLAKLQNATQRIYQASIGWYGILWTAWLGTPVHELSHAFFAKLFAHRIDAIQLFRPNRDTGILGQVDHSYNKRNPYQNIGNFFIGAAPMIIGCVVLTLLFHYMLPGSGTLLAEVEKINLALPQQTFTILLKISREFFSASNLHSPRFWIFLYVSFCVATHLAPSSYDQKTMWRGLIWLFLLLLVMNACLQYFHWNILSLSGYISLSFLTFAFWYALIVSTAHLVAAWIVFLPIRLIRR